MRITKYGYTWIILIIIRVKLNKMQYIKMKWLIDNVSNKFTILNVKNLKTIANVLSDIIHLQKQIFLSRITF